MPASPTRNAFVCAVFALGLSLGGCAHVHETKVDATAQSGGAAQRIAYSIHEVPTPASPRPIDAAAGKQNIRAALAAKGMDEATAPDQVEIEVTYAYNLREYRRPRTVSEPVYRSSPGGTYTETELGMDANGIMTSRTVTRSLPEIPFVERTSERQITDIRYEKSLHIVAVEKKSTTRGIPPRDWDILISYEDKDPSLNKAMPLLAAAGCARIGAKTGGPITVRLRSKDEVVAFINRGS
jgi:hypothetical protein